MSVEKVRAYLEHFGVSDRIREFDVSSATVELAAVAVGVEPARIAKTLSFKLGEDPILVVAAGDAKIDNSKYKHFFGMKAKMLTPEEAVERIGHAVGGVCPFALPEDVKTYLDRSLRRFDTVFPAVGSAASAIELTCDQLERCCGANFAGWVDVCKGWQEWILQTPRLFLREMTQDDLPALCRTLQTKRPCTPTSTRSAGRKRRLGSTASSTATAVTVSACGPLF